MDPELSPEYGPRWSDQRVERMLGALVCAVVGLLLALIATVFVRAWPSFAHNGLAWFGAGGSVDDQLEAISLSAQTGGGYVYTFHAWPLIWSTLLITGAAVAIALVAALFVAVFIVEFAPRWMSDVLQPVVRFLASVPQALRVGVAHSAHLVEDVPMELHDEPVDLVIAPGEVVVTGARGGTA